MSHCKGSLGVIAICFHQNTRPICYEQFWTWIEQALPGEEKVYMLGLAAICWAIWKARNILCFDKKPIKSHFEIIFSACALMCYWAGLYPGADQGRNEPDGTDCNQPLEEPGGGKDCTGTEGHRKYSDG
jgi:hypothetical protein